MREDFFDDSYYTELVGIQEDLKELKKQVEILTQTNTAILDILVSLIKDSSDEEPLTLKPLPLNIKEYLHKNILMVRSDKTECIQFAQEIANINEKTLKIIDSRLSVIDFVGIMNDLASDDYLFLDYQFILGNSAVEKDLLRAMKDGEVEIQIGKGEVARTIVLDLPQLHFLIYTSKRKLISEPIIQLMQCQI